MSRFVAVAYSAIAYSAVAYSAVAYRAIAGSAVAYSAVAYSAVAYNTFTCTHVAPTVHKMKNATSAPRPQREVQSCMGAESALASPLLKLIHPRCLHPHSPLVSAAQIRVSAWWVARPRDGSVAPFARQIQRATRVARDFVVEGAFLSVVLSRIFCCSI